MLDLEIKDQEQFQPELDQKSMRVLATIPPKLWLRFYQEAERECITINQWIVWAAKKYLSEQSEELARGDREKSRL
jgi:hypothetical protein